MFNVERLRLGDPFTIPTTPDELDLMVGWFWERIILIVTVENHVMKYHNKDQVLEILREAAEVEDIHITFYESEGWWNIESAESKEDILNLPRVAYRFSRVYRHHAKEYITGPREDIKKLTEGMDGLKDGKETDKTD